MVKVVGRYRTQAVNLDHPNSTCYHTGYCIRPFVAIHKVTHKASSIAGIRRIVATIDTHRMDFATTNRKGSTHRDSIIIRRGFTITFLAYLTYSACSVAAFHFTVSTEVIIIARIDPLIADFDLQTTIATLLLISLQIALKLADQADQTGPFVVVINQIAIVMMGQLAFAKLRLPSSVVQHLDIIVDCIIAVIADSGLPFDSYLDIVVVGLHNFITHPYAALRRLNSLSDLIDQIIFP